MTDKVKNLIDEARMFNLASMKAAEKGCDAIAKDYQAYAKKLTDKARRLKK